MTIKLYTLDGRPCRVDWQARTTTNRLHGSAHQVVNVWFTDTYRGEWLPMAQVSRKVRCARCDKNAIRSCTCEVD